MTAALIGCGWLVLGAVLTWRDVPPLKPVAAISAGPPPLTIQTCAECHPGQCETFRSAPHHNTLIPMSDPEIRALFAGRSVTLPPDDVRFEFVEEGEELWLHSDVYPKPLRVEWVFGSGSHARTPVSVWQNPNGETELLEHHVSWYPDGELGATLGTMEDRELGMGLAAIGEWLNHNQARGCFSCHVTYLPTSEGTFDESRMERGVNCGRCHTNTHQHVNAMNNGDTETFMADWKDLSPLDSINRCGECHRRADQLTAADLQTTNELLVRFAPAALSQSPCFQRQADFNTDGSRNGRLDCMTCHNPHQPATREAAHYIRKCLNCHGEQTTQAPVCAAEPMTSQCLSCHMPPVRIHSNLTFTDHWIRIREPETP